MNKKNWTKNDINKLKVLRKSGYTIREIASIFMASTSTIHVKLLEFGFNFKKPKIPAPMSWEEFFRIYGEKS